MRKTILLALVCLVLSGCASAQNRDAEYALGYVCGMLHKDCSAVPVPTVVYADMRALFGADYGGAFTAASPQVVHMDINLLGIARGRRMQILVHEVTHYVDYHFGITMPPHGNDACVTEGLAFSISNLWSLENDVPPRWNWREAYNGC